ncbi:hypothetical protein A2U01_0068506, partial [Trifolium medium]|nr:hypothetical protein [Trifolium medium]
WDLSKVFCSAVCVCAGVLVGNWIFACVSSLFPAGTAAIGSDLFRLQCVRS